MHADLPNRSRRLCCICSGTLAVALLTTCPAVAGMLAIDGNVMPGWQGTETFTSTPPTPLPLLDFFAEVDYAVFAPGTFELSFPGEDPSAGTEFVYAYQIFNTGPPQNDSLRQLTVGLDGDESLSTIAAIGSGIVPTSVRFQGAAPSFTSAAFSFADNKIPPGDPDPSSNILIFTSRNGPEFDAATILANFSAGSGELPSPVPEPGAIVLLVVGVAATLLRRRMASH